MLKSLAFKWATALTLAAVLLLGSAGASWPDAQANDNLAAVWGLTGLDAALAAVDRQFPGGGDPKTIEDKFLPLLKEYKTPEDAGRIYAQITRTYEQSGPKAEPAKLLAYCTKALQYPLDLLDDTKMHLTSGIELRRMAPKEGGAEYARARRTFVMPFLTGLKLLLDNKVPAEPPPPPLLKSYPLSPGTPDYEENLGKWRQERARYEAYLRLEDLVCTGRVLIGAIAGSYSDKPYATDELQQLATVVLKDKDMVQQLVTRTEANIKSRSD
jgi:hypothetical protein